ncbi:CNNM domain-containing protein [Planctomicrobium sp. SH661]|uniref:CNNM domain-containing protein n=1 Tax=Planctomicrobium sp. SH661 TaxID=3448124 RepID=UPI003F5B2BF3
MSVLVESAPEWIPGLLAMAVLIVLSAFYSAAETAMFYLSRDELRRMQTGSPGERTVATLMRDPDRLLSVVLFWNLVVNLLYFAVSLVAARRLVNAGYPSVAATLSLVGFFGLILFGEVAPKSLAVRIRRPLSVLASGPIYLSARVLDPVLPFFSTTTAALRRVFWPNLKQEPYLEVDDIERAVETSELGVEIVQLEQQILTRILELSDMTAEEIMRPRGTYHVWQVPVHLSDLKSRGTIPEVMLIAGEDRDNVTKALTLYDLNSLPEKNLETVAQQVIHVPWCATVADTLSRLRSGVVSVASVINEYGETIGIVTEDDILDTLLNPQSSRGRRLLEREPVTTDAQGRTVADGLATLRYLASKLDVDYEIEEDSPVTVVALLHHELERFPVIGDECIWEGYRVRVIQAGEPGDPVQVSLEKLPSPDDKAAD